MDRCISPRPMTRKESFVAESSTFRATSFSSSRIRRSRIWREVTYLPSLPANGESLTEKVISTVGSLILTKGRGCTLLGSQIVLPMEISGRPANATMSPAWALSIGSRPLALKSNSLVMRPLMCTSGLCQSQTWIGLPTLMTPFCTRPTPMRPTKSL